MLFSQKFPHLLYLPQMMVLRDPSTTRNRQQFLLAIVLGHNLKNKCLKNRDFQKMLFSQNFPILLLCDTYSGNRRPPNYIKPVTLSLGNFFYLSQGSDPVWYVYKGEDMLFLMSGNTSCLTCWRSHQKVRLSNGSVSVVRRRPSVRPSVVNNFENHGTFFR